ncbi:hypothetical protein Efla_004994 [Eimeria flavescens]
MKVSRPLAAAVPSAKALRECPSEPPGVREEDQGCRLSAGEDAAAAGAAADAAEGCSSPKAVEPLAKRQRSVPTAERASGTQAEAASRDEREEATPAIAADAGSMSPQLSEQLQQQQQEQQQLHNEQKQVQQMQQLLLGESLDGGVGPSEKGRSDSAVMGGDSGEPPGGASWDASTAAHPMGHGSGLSLGVFFQSSAEDALLDAVLSSHQQLGPHADRHILHADGGFGASPSSPLGFSALRAEADASCAPAETASTTSPEAAAAACAAAGEAARAAQDEELAAAAATSAWAADGATGLSEAASMEEPGSLEGAGGQQARSSRSGGSRALNAASAHAASADAAAADAAVADTSAAADAAGAAVAEAAAAADAFPRQNEAAYCVNSAVRADFAASDGIPASAAGRHFASSSTSGAPSGRSNGSNNRSSNEDNICSETQGAEGSSGQPVGDAARTEGGGNGSSSSDSSNSSSSSRSNSSSSSGCGEELAELVEPHSEEVKEVIDLSDAEAVESEGDAGDDDGVAVVDVETEPFICVESAPIAADTPEALQPTRGPQRPLGTGAHPDAQAVVLDSDDDDVVELRVREGPSSASVGGRFSHYLSGHPMLYPQALARNFPGMPMSAHLRHQLLQQEMERRRDEDDGNTNPALPRCPICLKKYRQQQQEEAATSEEHKNKPDDPDQGGQAAAGGPDNSGSPEAPQQTAAARGVAGAQLGRQEGWDAAAQKPLLAAAADAAESDKDHVVALKCGHVFCKGCILAALRSRRQCPVCRVALRGGFRLGIGTGEHILPGLTSACPRGTGGDDA